MTNLPLLLRSLTVEVILGVTPNMTVARADPRTISILQDEDKKIYVMGGCSIDEYSSNWIEVFDIKTQSWTALPIEDELLISDLRGYFTLVDVFERKLYVATLGKDYTYDLKDDTWKAVREQPSLILPDSIRCWFELGNTLYGWNDLGCLRWSVSHYHTKGREWREIKGLENLLEDSKIGLKNGRVLAMDEYEGKILVMWDPYYHDTSNGIKREENEIWYAKISLESRSSSCNNNEREVWGKVECADVLTFPGQSYEFFGCFGVRV